MKTYLVFTIQAYSTEGEFQDGSQRLNDITTLRLIDKTYKKALTKAKKIIDKKYYRLSEVTEFEVKE